MSKLIDLINKKFNRLLVIQRRQNDKWGQSMWLCKCDCGSEVTTTSHHLREGHTKSCGCVHIRHGHTEKKQKSTTYRSWDHIVQRCTNPNNSQYKDYGNRGIVICKRWMKFENFLKDMGERPLGLTIERKDNNKGYHKGNCIWATRKQQMRNTRRNRKITYNNKTQCITDWAKEFNLNLETIRYRIYTAGWPIKKAFLTPVMKRKNNAIHK